MSGTAKLTPMMRQYRDLKAEVADDVLLLFRMGDFYEMFFEDAVRGGELMEITVTKRAGCPMSGIPHHALKEYLPRILQAGVKAAIAEQVEDPKEAKGIVRREITQIITPGTIVEGTVLAAGKSNFLVSICTSKKHTGLATLDISTGDFRITQLDTHEQLEAEIHRLQPAECLLPEGLYKRWEADGFPDAPKRMLWTPVDDWTFDESVATDLLRKQFEVTSLDGFGCREFPLGIQAGGAILHYACHNLRRNADHITTLSVYSAQSFMHVDRTTQRNLELVEPLFTDSRDSTLYSVLNETMTPMGARRLREWILRPLRDLAAIQARQDAVEVFTADQLLLVELREVLRAIRDLERTIARLNVGSANARDLQLLRRGLEIIPAIRAILAVHESSALLNGLSGAMHEFEDLTSLITSAIVEEPPLTVKDGSIIAESYNAQLDEFRAAGAEGKSWIAKLQLDEQERTGVKSLKVRYNKVFGYYIEVSKANIDKVPEDYIRKQTLVNAERFITPELKEIEHKVLGAEEKSKALEYEIFQTIRGEVIAQTAQIQQTAAAIAVLDVIAGFAETALKSDYTRPEMHEGLEIDIAGGRHPVIDRLMREERFVPNDLELNGDDSQMIILTGPNMAGKSTYIRQAALLVLLGQIGSFIPAQKARIGLADRIFTRVGAADDLSRGQSTFMVEMLETANILNNATPQSLIILDEIGRGTSTYDGLSIAWAVAEFIHNTPSARSRTLFATHYHELTQLALTMRGVQNFNVSVRESGDTVVFLHKIIPGAADRSYGIYVARMAGLPDKLITRANEVLKNLEGNAFDQADTPKIAKRRRTSSAAEHPSLFDL
jgi:DNA mismatch repair protein MutS